MAGDDQFLASGHYGSDTTSKRLQDGWSPGGRDAESYIDGSMDPESSKRYESLVAPENSQERNAILEADMSEITKTFAKLKPTTTWCDCK
jgi:hypothetical protein